jgi:hypothetical protein
MRGIIFADLIATIGARHRALHDLNEVRLNEARLI